MRNFFFSLRAIDLNKNQPIALKMTNTKRGGGTNINNPSIMYYVVFGYF